MTKVDMALNYDKGYWDISLADDGDYKTTGGLDTSLLISMLTDSRASETQQPVESLRRGWWGNLFIDITYGSLLWLAAGAGLTSDSSNEIVSYTYDALNWTISQGYFTKIEVGANVNIEKGAVFVNVQFSQNNVVTKKTYEILQET